MGTGRVEARRIDDDFFVHHEVTKGTKQSTHDVAGGIIRVVAASERLYIVAEGVAL